MIRIFSVLSIILCYLLLYGCAANSEVSAYREGGKHFVPDALYAQKLCQDPRFTCRVVRRSDAWEDLFPDAKQRELVERINRTNVPLQYRPFIILPRDIKKINYEALSPLPQHYDTKGKRLLYVDLDKFAFAAYDKNGERVLWGPASGGQPWCDDVQASCLTATGTFHVFKMEGENCQSRTYPVETKGGAPMPYCMYYYQGFAIHGSTLSGFINRSHGCIRLFDDDAKWLNQHFVQLGTEVIVTQ